MTKKEVQTLEQLRTRLAELRRDLIPARAKVETILSEMYKIEYRIAQYRPMSADRIYKPEPFGTPHGMPKELKDVIVDRTKLKFDLDEFSKELEGLDL